MSDVNPGRVVRSRLVVAGGLAIAATILFFVGPFAVRDERPAIPSFDVARIDAAVDSLLEEYNIERNWIRTWQKRTPDKKFLRIERRVFVPPEFVSISFNHSLKRRVAEFGASVMATERTREQIVAVHVSHEGRVVESITFVVKSELGKSKRKTLF